MPSNKWSFRLVLATFSLIGLVFTGASPVAAGDDDGSSAWPSGCVAADSSTPGDGFTAPAPCKSDASGTDQDRYYIPQVTFEHPQYGFGMYYVDGKAQDEGWHSTEDAASITVTTSFNSGTWTFNYTDETAGGEAKNKYRIEVGEGCKTGPYGDKYTEVTAYFTNVDDDTDRYVHSIHPYTMSQRGIIATDVDTAFDVADGETVAMRIMIFADELPGLTPGVWVSKFRRADRGSAGSRGYIVKKVRYTVPKCGKSPASMEARGNLKRIGCKSVKVTADARGYTATPKASYRLVKKPFGKRARQGSFAVAAGQKHSFMVKKPGRTKATVTLKVKRPSGSWVRLDRVGLPRCR